MIPGGVRDKDDIPGPLYAYAFLIGGFAMAFHEYLFLAVAAIWCAYGLYKQVTAGVPA